MGLWNAIQQKVWTGKVLKDYGAISDDRHVLGVSRTLSVVLTEKKGRRLFLRESWRGFAGFRIIFIELDREAATRLGAIIEDALAQM
jgi:hypothetical protein